MTDVGDDLIEMANKLIEVKEEIKVGFKLDHTPWGELKQSDLIWNTQNDMLKPQLKFSPPVDNSYF